MKRIPCPVNGPRPASEFHYAGEVRPMPDPDRCSDAEWTDYVFNRSGVAGVKREWWLHVPSGVWFVAERDTARDVFLRTYLWSRRAEAQSS
jgi:sarcosine oxidase subunit delta